MCIAVRALYLYGTSGSRDPLIRRDVLQRGGGMGLHHRHRKWC